MALWKATMHFAAGKYGWSECWYTQSDLPTVAFARMQQLGDVRSAMLGQGASLTRLILSLMGQFRVTLVSGARPDPIPIPILSPLQGAMVMLAARDPGVSDTYRRTMLFRGVQANFFGPVVKGQQTYNPVGLARLQAFLGVLCNGDWLVLAGDKKLPWHPVSWLVVAAEGGTDPLGQGVDLPDQVSGTAIVSCFLDPDVSIPARDPVTGISTACCLRNPRFKPQRSASAAGVGGVHRLIRSLPGFVSMQGHKVPIGEYQGGGFLQVRQPVYATLTKGTVGLLGTRKCGKVIYPDIASRTNPVAGGFVAPPPFVKHSEPPEQWGPFAGINVIENARDLAAYVFKGYTENRNGLNYAITIQPFAHTPRTWLVTLTGLSLEFNSDRGAPQAILSAFGQPNRYSVGITKAITKVIPHGHAITFAGHSLGGMEAQNFVWATDSGVYEFRTVIGYGSPVTLPAFPGVKYALYIESADPIRLLPLPGDLLPPGIRPTTLAVADSLPNKLPSLAHSFYPQSPKLGFVSPGAATFTGEIWNLGKARYFAADGTEIE